MEEGGVPLSPRTVEAAMKNNPSCHSESVDTSDAPERREQTRPISPSLASDSSEETPHTATSRFSFDRRRSAEETTRNLVHPHVKTTIIDLLSESATSSALPESYGLAISRKGGNIVIFSSTYIYIVNGPELPVVSLRLLQTDRRPVAVDITDDGRILAILTDPHSLDVYDLKSDERGKITKRPTIALENECTTITLSPDVLVAAAGYPHGVEIVSLADDAKEPAKRHVLCPRPDKITFSDDSRTFLATNAARNMQSSALISVHEVDRDIFTEDWERFVQATDKAWTSHVLFPQELRSVSQACMLPDPTTSQIGELFAWNQLEDSWGVFETVKERFQEDKDFVPIETVPTRENRPFLENVIPCVSTRCYHAAVAVKSDSGNGTDIILYRLPDDWENGSGTYSETDANHAGLLPRHACSQLHIDLDPLCTSQEITTMNWVSYGSEGQEHGLDRLVVLGNAVWHAAEDETAQPVSIRVSARLVIFDFDFTSEESREPTQKVLIPLDQYHPGEKLPTERLGFEQEVELLRRRTVAQRNREMIRRSSPQEQRTNARTLSSTSLVRAMTFVPRRSAAAPRAPADEDPLTSDEAQAALEEPYVQGAPRPVASLARAATVAASAPANRRHLLSLPDRPLEYRRADGLREIPHESDADNWVAPPPPYTPNPNAPGAPNAAHTYESFPQLPEPARWYIPDILVRNSTSSHPTQGVIPPHATRVPESPPPPITAPDSRARLQRIRPGEDPLPILANPRVPQTPRYSLRNGFGEHDAPFFGTRPAQPSIPSTSTATQSSSSPGTPLDYRTADEVLRELQSSLTFPQGSIRYRRPSSPAPPPPPERGLAGIWSNVRASLSTGSLEIPGWAPRRRSQSVDQTVAPMPSGERTSASTPSGDRPSSGVHNRERPSRRTPGGDRPSRATPAGERAGRRAPSSDRFAPRNSRDRTRLRRSRNTHMGVSRLDTIRSVGTMSSQERRNMIRSSAHLPLDPLLETQQSGNGKEKKGAFKCVMM